MRARARRSLVAGALVAAVAILALLSLAGARGVGAHETARDATRGREANLRAGIAASRAGGREGPLERAECSLDHAIAELRAASRSGSAAYRAYALDVMVDLAHRLPLERVLSMFEGERDPLVLEALGRVLCKCYAENGDGAVLDRLLARAQRDPDPARRAAVVRALGATEDPSGAALRAHGGVTYDALVRDPDPSVRDAVVANLGMDIEASAGHEPSTSSEALRVAQAATAPATRAAILERVSLEAASASDVATARAMLDADGASWRVRTAAARALGTVGAGHARETFDALVARYREPQPRSVRIAILAAIVQIRFAAAIPALEALEPIDGSLVPEIEAWIAALRGGAQLYSRLEQEKERYQREQEAADE